MVNFMIFDYQKMVLKSVNQNHKKVVKERKMCKKTPQPRKNHQLIHDNKPKCYTFV